MHGNYCVFLRFQKFSCAFLAFSLTANAREFKKTLVFPTFTVRWTFWKYRVFLCSQEFSSIFWDSEFRWIQVSACFLAFTFQLMDEKLRKFQCFPCVFLHLGTFGTGLFQCPPGGIIRSLPPCSRLLWSFYSSTTCWLPMFRELKLIPFPNQNSKSKRHF